MSYYLTYLDDCLAEKKLSNEIKPEFLRKSLGQIEKRLDLKEIKIDIQWKGGLNLV
jgi:hypothetical protein